KSVIKYYYKLRMKSTQTTNYSFSPNLRTLNWSSEGASAGEERLNNLKGSEIINELIV
ncbi:uncharacterized protein METZ01_LOCUS361241, partial [marine metagenome]